MTANNSELRWDAKTGSLTINLDALAEPARSFAAQVVRLDRIPAGGSTFHLTFGQMLTADRLLGTVVIQMELDSVAGFLKSCNSGFRDTLARNTRGHVAPPRIETRWLESISEARCWFGHASVARGSVSLNGAQLDFYETSPRMLVKFLRREESSTVPGVMTIFLSAGCLKQLLDEIDAEINPKPIAKVE